jgi:hypothetical protein
MQARYAIPIRERSSAPWSRTFQGLLFALTFDLGCLMINGTQFLFLPLKLVNSSWYKEAICYTKGAFGCLLSMSTPPTYLDLSIIFH